MLKRTHAVQRKSLNFRLAPYRITPARTPREWKYCLAFRKDCSGGPAGEGKRVGYALARLIEDA